jgi:hypothetical protein
VRSARAWFWVAVGTSTILAAVLASCSVPALDLTGKKCQTDQDCNGGGSCRVDGTCAAPEDAGDSGPESGPPTESGASFAFCTAIPRLTRPPTVDGQPDEFPSGLAHYSTGMAGGLTTVQAGKHLAQDVDVGAGWSDGGVLLFFHVDYQTGDSVIVPGAQDPLYYGDGVEVFLKGNGLLSGSYDGVTEDPGALQFIVVPKTDQIPERGQIYANAGLYDGGSIDTNDYTAFVVQDPDGGVGYNVEMAIPWSLIVVDGGTWPSADASIGFDFAVDYHTRPADAAPSVDYQGALSDNTSNDGGLPPACGQSVGSLDTPSCDDLTWCRPTLTP